jgi:hypothetical protein
MRTVITAQGFDLSETLRDSVRREIERFVQSARRPVNVVAVHLVDGHGHPVDLQGRVVRGGDKVCRVCVGFSDDDAEVEDVDSESRFDQSVTEAFIKVMRAAPRLRTSATRHLARAS